MRTIRQRLVSLALVATAVALTALLGAAASATDTDQWFPFTPPWDDAADTLLSSADLLVDHPGDDPAAVIDARGFVTTDANGHFVFSNTGARVRFWGVNFSFGGNFPVSPANPAGPGEFGSPDDAEKLAARLAKLGFNAVRLHHVDNQSRPHGIWLDRDNNTQQIDAVQLERLDHFIYQLKRRGIYVNLNLHVSREFVAGDGVTAADAYQASDVSYNKNATLFDPITIALQQQYAAALLTHVNPYTGLAYKDDPVIFTTETTNENALFLGWVQDELNWDAADPAASIPAFYSRQLDGWSDAHGQPAVNRLANAGFDTGLDGWFTYVADPADAAFSRDGGALRVDVVQSGDAGWKIQFGQGNLALLGGQPYRLRFAVRADRPTTVEGAIMRNAEPWDNFGWYSAVDVTTAWVTHTVDFTATETAFGSARVSFDLGRLAPGTTLWFDGFQLVEANAFRGWHGWLADKYGTTAAIAAAWAPATVVPEDELLANGSFEAGLAPWLHFSQEGAAAGVAIDGATATAGARSVRINVTQVGGEDWHVQLWQPGLAIVAGQRYRLSFDAKTSAPGPIGASVIQTHAPWAGLGAWLTAELTPSWQSFAVEFEATDDEADARVNFDLGQTVRSIWIDNVSLRPSNPRGLLPEESLEANNIARLRRSERFGYTPQRVRDLVAFYADVEAGYFGAMRTYLQQTLGSRALNTGTANYFDHLPTVAAMAETDFVDNHTYWDHPWWPNAPAWSETGWVIGNASMLNNPFGSLFDKAVTAVAGKPFTLTEFNAAAPNRYEVEGPLLVAAIGNLQDWDGIFIYSYGHSQEINRAEAISGFFDIAGNPIDIGVMPVAARLFLGRQTAPAPAETLLPLTAEETLDATTVDWRGGSADFWQQVKGIDPAAVLGSRLRLAGFDAAAPITPTVAAPVGPVYVSGGGQLTWDTTDPARGIFTADAPSFQAAIGFAAGRTVTLSQIEVAVATNSAEFVAVTYQPVDGRPIATAGDLLLGVFTRAENSGMVWNADQTSLDNRWGTAPALIEPVRLTVTATVATADTATVWALDATGAPKAQTPHQAAAADRISFEVDTAADATLWYAIVVRQAPTSTALTENDTRPTAARPAVLLLLGGCLIAGALAALQARRWLRQHRAERPLDRPRS